MERERGANLWRQLRDMWLPCVNVLGDHTCYKRAKLVTSHGDPKQEVKSWRLG